MRVIVLVMMMLLFCFRKTEAAIERLPIGNFGTVENYDYTNCIWLRNILVSSDGHIQSRPYSIPGAHDKAGVISLFQSKLQIDMESVLTNTSFDKSKAVQIISIFNRGVDVDYSNLYLNQAIFFPKATNGAYKTPNLDLIVPQVAADFIPIGIKNLKWGRIEINKVVTKVPLTLKSFFITDSRYNTNHPVATNFFTAIEPDFAPRSGVCSIGIPYAVSGTNGSYRLKITLVSGINNDFEIFDELGNKIPETPFEIRNLVDSPGYLDLDIVGGDTGRVFTLLKSSDLINWSGAGNTNVITFGQKIHFSVPKTGTDGMFVKTQTIEIPPTLIK